MRPTLAPLALLTLTSALPSHPQVTPAAANNKRDGEGAATLTAITITLANSMAEAISTSLASNADGPSLVEGAAAPTGTVAAGERATFVAPMGWAGNVAVGLARYGGTLEMPTLVEAGLSDFGAGGMMDVDVSFVNGYTVSVTCTCDAGDAPAAWLAGCSADLWALGACGAGGETDRRDAAGVCVNPTNEPTRAARAATAFFEPCAGRAYTFPSDDGANSLGMCAAGAVTCCVGTEADGCSGMP